MRDWVASLEQVLDNKLRKWKKESRIENGEAVQVEWQYEQTHIIIDIFWEDGRELVRLNYIAPRSTHHWTWHDLNDKTFNKVQDRVGNLATVTMCPPIDPEFPTDGR